MAVTQNPQNIVKVGFNGYTKAGYVIENIDHESAGDIERISGDGSILTYIASNAARVLRLSLLVNGSAGAGGAGNVQPPAKASTFTITVPATATELDEDSASPASMEFIVIEAAARRVPGATRLDLTLERVAGHNYN